MIKNIFAILILLVNVNYAIACSCIPQKMSVKKILNYDLVFEGKIIKKEVVKNIINTKGDTLLDFSQVNYFKYTFHIKNIINGNYSQKYVNIYSPTFSAACGANYYIDDKYYIYSNEYQGIHYTNSCSQNKKNSEANCRYKKIIRKYIKAKKNKKWKDIDNNLNAIGKVINKKAEGFWKFFHEDSTLACEGLYLRGKKFGLWKYYYNQRYSEKLFKKMNIEQRKQVKISQNIYVYSIEYDAGLLIKRVDKYK